MISSDVAFALNASGLVWHPTAGDRFLIHRNDFESEVFTLSDMTIEAHEYSTGTILGFNGTTEWALDSVALEDSLWLPREDQLRDLIGDRFRSLVRTDEGFTVEIEQSNGERAVFTEADPADAYARALLALISASALA
jgi:hypothetical protein